MAHLWWENYFHVGKAGRLLISSLGRWESREAERKKKKKTRYKRIPQMNRIIVAQQGHGRHPPASRHAGGICRLRIKEILKTIPSERLVRTNRKLKTPSIGNSHRMETERENPVVHRSP